MNSELFSPYSLSKVRHLFSFGAISREVLKGLPCARGWLHEFVFRSQVIISKGEGGVRRPHECPGLADNPWSVALQGHAEAGGSFDGNG